MKTASHNTKLRNVKALNLKTLVATSMLSFGVIANAHATSTMVTDAVGTQELWTFQEILGAQKLVSKINQVDGKGITQTWDANGNILTRTDAEGKVTSYTYNATNQKTAMTEADGTTEARTTTYTYVNADIDLVASISSPSIYGSNTKSVVNTYDTNLNITGVTINGFDTLGNAVSRTTTFDHDTYGKVTEIDGPRTDVNDITTLDYYDCNTGAECGQLMKVTNALGHETTYDSYDGAARLLQMTDPNGIVITYTYHPRGWLLTMTQTPPAGETSSEGEEQGGAAPRVTTYDYDNVGQLTKVTLPDASELNYVYDAAHDLREITDNLGNKITYLYDAKGNRTHEEIFDPDGTLVRSTITSYDHRNFIESINNAGSVTQLINDAVGNLSTQTDPKQNPSTDHSYDALDRLTQTIDALTNNTNYQYNIADHLTQVTSPNGATTIYEYDDLGNQTKEISSDRGTLLYTHDNAGNVSSITDARGITRTYSYDALNRLMNVAYPNTNENVTYQFDAIESCGNGIGRLCQVNDESGQTNYAYDDWGNIIQQNKIELGNTYTTTYQYDAQNRITEIIYPDGRTVTYVRDAIGRIAGTLTHVGNTAQANVMINLGYRADGLPKGAAYGNNLMEFRSYDTQGRLESLDFTGLLQQSFQYDANGNLTQRLPNAGTFDYDVLDRLTKETRTTIKDWTYDANGNRESEDDNGQFSPLTYEANSNRLATNNGIATTLDPAGNTINDGQFTYTYNDAGRLKTISQSGQVIATYTYQANGQRSQKVINPNSNPSTTLYHYDLMGNLIGESDDTGAFNAGYLYHQNQPIAIYKHDEATNSQQGDADDPNEGEAPPQEEEGEPTNDGRDGGGSTGQTTTTTSCDGTQNNGRGTPEECTEEENTETEESTPDPNAEPDEDGGSGEFPDETETPNTPWVYAPSDALQGLYYIHTDHLNTPRWATGQTGTLIWTWDSDAFGNTTPNEDVDNNGTTLTINHRFPGQYYDHESGLHYNWNRYYDPRSGRYVTSDPIGLNGGLNTFGYVYGNPLRFSDSSGLRPVPGNVTPKRRCQLNCWDKWLIGNAAGAACGLVSIKNPFGAGLAYVGCRAAATKGHFNLAECLNDCEEDEC